MLSTERCAGTLHRSCESLRDILFVRTVSASGLWSAEFPPQGDHKWLRNIFLIATSQPWLPLPVKCLLFLLRLHLCLYFSVLRMLRSMLHRSVYDF